MKCPPNILLLMTDQQRADTVSALGNPIIRTPVLDRLTREGTSFTRCYTPSPVCVSARCALMTGLAPHVSGCVDNMPMPTDVPTLPARLGMSGYQTHGIGKMHFNPDSTAAWGFDSRDISEEMPSSDDDYVDFLCENGFDHVTEPHGVRSEFYYVPQPSQLPTALHHTHWVADRSIKYLRERDTSRPFFLMSSFIKPHPPFENPSPFDKLYRGPDMPGPLRRREEQQLWTYWNRVQNRYKYADAGFDLRLAQLRQSAYYAAISFIDQQIGRIIDSLGDAIDNTLILFTADHGELLGDYGCVGKRSMLDAAARIPMIARLPGVFKPGRRCEAATSLLDIMPTCLARAETDTGEVSGDGNDLASVAAVPDPDRTVYAQLQRGRYGLYMAANAKQKFVRSAADNREWLFHGTAEDNPDEFAHCVDTGKSVADNTLAASLRQRFTEAGYTEAVADNRWVGYQPPEFPEATDSGLLFQDSQDLESQLRSIGDGYAREGYVGGTELLDTPRPFEKPGDHGQEGTPAPKPKRQRVKPVVPAMRSISVEGVN
ncbi:MAG: sulfatase-like hydrolase/transferase [Planctomycetota bacterium]